MTDAPLRQALVAEALGSFVLVFAGCGALAVGTLPPAAVAATFGLAIMVSIFAFGHVSGGHFNPAVTIGFVVGHHFPVTRIPPYLAAQGLGAIVAAAVLRLSLGPGPLGSTHPSGTAVQAFSWEMVLSAVLMFTVLAVTTDSRAMTQAAAIAIGGAVALGALVGGPISGGSMNPARSLGPAVVSGDLGDLWIYLSAPIVGAIVAVVAYDRLRPSGSSRA